MTNQNENQCEICELFNVYEKMIADGIEPIQAFHTIIEDVESDSYREGFVDALFNVYKNVGDHIDNILEPCDCEVCNGECDEIN